MKNAKKWCQWLALFVAAVLLLPSAAYAAGGAGGGVLAGMTAEEKVAQMIMPAFRWYPAKTANGRS